MRLCGNWEEIAFFGSVHLEELDTLVLALVRTKSS